MLMVCMSWGCGSSATSDQTPEAAIDAFFDAAGRGDDAAYLRLTSGRLRESLESARSELGVEAFRDHLRQSAAGIKGLAKTRGDDDPSAGDTASGDTAAIDVELVFADRNERQRILLALEGSRWVITSIDTARRIEPEIPYGTPVFEEPKEDPDAPTRP